MKRSHYQKVLLLSIGQLLCLVSCDPGRGGKNFQTLSGEDTLYFTLMTETGWTLDIFPGGSGRLSFGSVSSDTAPVREGTFDFAALKKQLSVHAQVRKFGPSPASVVFVAPSQQNYAPRYLDNSEFVNTLFERAYQAIRNDTGPVYNRRRVGKLYREFPFVE
ncbi:MAG: hypothetical protein DHS20C18_12050 [Saprospiraceae bacterium]|nr:MAG: hypothetical protein DHS20C18_12050 [Saprospiraceae bacterium]